MLCVGLAYGWRRVQMKATPPPVAKVVVSLQAQTLGGKLESKKISKSGRQVKRLMLEVVSHYCLTWRGGGCLQSSMDIGKGRQPLAGETSTFNGFWAGV